MSTEAELQLYVDYFNEVAVDFADCKSALPLDPSNIFEKLSDGVLCARLVNVVDKSGLPGRLIKAGDGVGVHTAVIKALNGDKIKRKVTFSPDVLASGDAKEMHPYLWEVLRAHLMRNINLVENTALIRSLKDGEGLDTLFSLDAEGVLLRWANYHINRSGKGGSEEEENLVVVKSVETDFNVKVWALIVDQIFNVDKEQKSDVILTGGSTEEQAKLLLSELDTVAINKFITVESIVNNYWKVNLAFVAHVFNERIGMYLPTEEEMDVIMNELRDLAAKLSNCESECARLTERISILEAELELLRAKKSGLDEELIHKNNLLEEKNVEFTRRSELADAEIVMLNQKIKDRESEIAEAVEKIGALKQKRADFETSSQQTIEEQLKKIEELKATLTQLEEEKARLSELVGGKGDEAAQIHEELIKANNTSNDKSRAIAEHIEKVHGKVNEWGSNFNPATTFTFEAKDNEKEDLEAALEAQQKLLEQYETAIKELDDTFARQKGDARRRMDEINNLVSEYLGSGQSNPGDAIANMKRLLELMIEKCKKQAQQIAIFDATIEKMDDLNSLVKDKIKSYADSNIEKGGKKKKGKK